MELILNPDKKFGKFIADDKNPKLITTDHEMGIFVMGVKSINIKLIQLELINNPSDLKIMINIKSFPDHNIIPIELDLSKYGDKFKVINNKYILDTKDIKLFSLPIDRNFFTIEASSLSNEPYKLEMYFDVIPYIKD